MERRRRGHGHAATGCMVTLLVVLGTLSALPAQAGAFDPLSAFSAHFADPSTLIVVAENTGGVAIEGAYVVLGGDDAASRSVLPPLPPGAVQAMPVVGAWSDGGHVIEFHYPAAFDPAIERVQRIELTVFGSPGDGFFAELTKPAQPEVVFTGGAPTPPPSRAFALFALIVAVAALPAELVVGYQLRKRRDAKRAAVKAVAGQ